jgi:archaellum biogenesis protein FlaJ (TadC family)
MQWWIILVAAVASFATGALFYGPLFGKQWMKAKWMTKKDMENQDKKQMQQTMIMGFIGHIIMATILAYFIAWVPLVVALRATTMIVIGFVMTTQLSNTIWDNHHNWPLFWLNVLGSLAMYLVGALVLLALM